MEKITIKEIKNLYIRKCQLIFYCPTIQSTYELMNIFDSKNLHPIYEHKTSCSEFFLKKRNILKYNKIAYAYNPNIFLRGIMSAQLRYWPNVMSEGCTFNNYKIVEVVPSNLNLNYEERICYYEKNINQPN